MSSTPPIDPSKAHPLVTPSELNKADLPSQAAADIVHCILREKNSGPIRATRVYCHYDDCKKKVPLGLQIVCRCENIFCSHHRMPELHRCPKLQELKEEGRQRLHKLLHYQPQPQHLAGSSKERHDNGAC